MSEDRKPINSYRDLIVWQKGMDLAVAVYRLTASFPIEERYGMTSQIRRSSASVPANIAEGYGRESAGAYAQQLRVAQGSLKELETHILLANRVGLVDADAITPLMQLSEEVGKMLRSLIRTL
jgi:four helix bundle protein